MFLGDSFPEFGQDNRSYLISYVRCGYEVHRLDFYGKLFHVSSSKSHERMAQQMNISGHSIKHRGTGFIRYKSYTLTIIF
jgi:hypothetical protein